MDLEFDFERDVHDMLPKLSPEDIINNLTDRGVGLGTSNKHRIIVCTHWLLGLCHHGGECSFLHRFDKSKMKPCKHGKLCKIKNCPLKHVAEDELEECIFYKQGFCCNGPKCGRRHIKRMPDECPAEVTFDPNSSAYANVLSYGAGSQANTVVQSSGKRLRASAPNDNFKVTLCTHYLLNMQCPFKDSCIFAHAEDEVNLGYQPNEEFLEDGDVYDPTKGQLHDTLSKLPFPASSASTSKCSYFILQAPDLRSLGIAQRRRVWSVPQRIVAEMNAAFRSSLHVIILFCVRPLRGLYGVAKMEEAIPSEIAGVMSKEFPIKWLRSLRVSLKTVAQVKIGNTGMFIGRSMVDSRFESKVGFDMLLTAYRKPEWDWAAEREQAEAGLRLTCESIALHTQHSTMYNEYYPSPGNNAYMLPPDHLFAPEWLERAGIPPNDKGLIFTAMAQAMHNKDQTRSAGPDQGSAAPAQTPLPPAQQFYTGTLPGFIFCATSPVVEEMFTRSLVGLPYQMQDSVVIHPAVPLFIFDTQAQLMLGMFHADSPTTLNMDPTAFVGWMGPGMNGGSPLPMQLRFRVALEVAPISIQDPELLGALAGNPPGGVMLPEVTQRVAQVFAMRSPVFQHQQHQEHQQQQQQQQQQEQGQGRGGGRPLQGGPVAGNQGYYKPPFKFTGEVPIDIPGNLYNIKKILLGTNASNIIAKVDSLGGTSVVRIRIRGMGSGYPEGPNRQELQQPLHFNVSADSEELLERSMAKMQEAVEGARVEMLSIIGAQQQFITRAS